MDTTNDIMTKAEVAALLRVSPRTVQRFTMNGRIPHRRIGRKPIYSRATITKWLEGSDLPPA